MQQWLAENKPVDGEDLERHDKWLCMMWPRLQLLRELLSDDGVIFVSIDDHEQWRLLGLLEDIFGEHNFIDTLIHVQNRGAVSGRFLREVNEFVHVFAKDAGLISFGRFVKEAPSGGWSNDEFGSYRLGANLVRIGLSGTPADRPNLYFPIYVSENGDIQTERRSSSDVEVVPTDGDGEPAVWRWSREKVNSESYNLLVKPHRRTTYQFQIKIRPDMEDNAFTEKPSSLWDKPSYSAATGTNAVKNLFAGERKFDFPKSVPFVTDLIRFANVGPDDIVLDSFAGSGTTAHAVLSLNAEDDGNRKFILAECEDYADSITAERVRQVIKGVTGARDQTLREGLGGEFTYCELGDPISIEGMLNGELPPYRDIASMAIHNATGLAPNDIPIEYDGDLGFVYESEWTRFHLLYRADAEWLRGEDGALNSEKANRISNAAIKTEKNAVVFAPSRYMSQRDLTDLGITFCQLPYDLTAPRLKSLQS